MNTFDAPMFRALLTARLREFAAGFGALTAAAAADVMMAVAVEAGLIMPDAHTTVPVFERAPLAVLVVAETLRARAAATSSYKILAADVLDALAALGFAYAPAPPAPVQLTAKQHRALVYYAQGLTYGEIASIVGCNWSTVRTHLEKARVALGARNTTHAAVLASAMGLLEGAEPRVPGQRAAVA